VPGVHDLAQHFQLLSRKVGDRHPVTGLPTPMFHIVMIVFDHPARDNPDVFTPRIS